MRLENQRGGFSRILYQALFGAFVLNLLLVWVKVVQPSWLAGNSLVPESILVVLGAATTLTAVLSELPAQNVLFASVLIAGFSFAADSLCAAAGLPRPRGQSPEDFGLSLVWAMPLIRVFEVLNSRGLARLLLRSRRRTTNYGLWVLGLTVLLAVLFETNLNPFATVVGRYWSWGPKGTGGWYGTPWLVIGTGAVTTLIIVPLMTPSLIDKCPSPGAADSGWNGNGAWWPPVKLFSFWAWACPNLLFLAAAAHRRLWLAALVVGLELLVLAALTVCGHALKQTPAGLASHPH